MLGLLEVLAGTVRQVLRANLDRLEYRVRRALAARAGRKVNRANQGLWELEAQQERLVQLDLRAHQEPQEPQGRQDQ